jgi:hypothetical protein
MDKSTEASFTADKKRELLDDHEFYWPDLAQCHLIEADPNMFFEYSRYVNAAKAICAVCVVRGECADWAISNPRVKIKWEKTLVKVTDQRFIYGGMNERERKLAKSAYDKYLKTNGNKNPEDMTFPEFIENQPVRFE